MVPGAHEGKAPLPTGLELEAPGSPDEQPTPRRPTANRSPKRFCQRCEFVLPTLMTPTSRLRPWDRNPVGLENPWMRRDGGITLPAEQAYLRAMEFRLLGPVEVVDEKKPVRLGGPKQRTVLVHLLLRVNRLVTS